MHGTIRTSSRPRRLAARRPRRAACAAALAVLLHGCSASSTLFQPVRATSMSEAGSVHVSVLAVAPWSEYVRELQPDFRLTADQALSRVARDSQWRVQDDARASGLGAESVLLDEAGDGKQPAKAESGLLGPLSGADPRFHPNDLQGLAPFGPNGGQALPEAEPDPGTGSDSMLKYTAAAALYQEVKLLNGYIRDASIPAGFRPYMVRLQVSLMPSRRHAPYDAYTTLSFFIPGDRSASALLAGTPDEWPRTTSDDIFMKPFGNGPKVLPLVVTDNLEASVQSRSFDRVQTLLASILNFPGDSFVEPLYSSLLFGALRDQVFGRDLNSLMTVARLSENTLRIRLGASQEATANYAMVPRNHNVTLLLMVPVGAPPLMEVVAKTVLVDAETGESLQVTPDAQLERALEELRVVAGVPELPTATLARLFALARANDQEAWSALLRTALDAGHPVLRDERSLWIELVSLTLDDQYTTNLFELPGQGEDLQGAAELFRNQTVILDDNGESASTVLREARFPEYEQVLAVLAVPEADPPVLLPAAAVRLDVSRHELRLEFPSVVRWGLVPDGGPAMQLRLSWAGQQQVFRVHGVISR